MRILVYGYNSVITAHGANLLEDTILKNGEKIKLSSLQKQFTQKIFF